MLVLTRKREEVIEIGDDIEVTVCDIRADKVRLGIVAPTQTVIHRKEVGELIRRGLRPRNVRPLGQGRPSYADLRHALEQVRLVARTALSRNDGATFQDMGRVLAQVELPLAAIEQADAGKVSR
jgi:carbon storage regulator CsrA